MPDANSHTICPNCGYVCLNDVRICSECGLAVRLRLRQLRYLNRRARGIDAVFSGFIGLVLLFPIALVQPVLVTFHKCIVKGRMPTIVFVAACIATIVITLPSFLVGLPVYGRLRSCRQLMSFSEVWYLLRYVKSFRLAVISIAVQSILVLAAFVGFAAYLDFADTTWKPSRNWNDQERLIAINSYLIFQATPFFSFLFGAFIRFRKPSTLRE